MKKLSSISKENKILLIIFFNISIIVGEIFFGVLSNSFALIADALHNTGDVIAIIITYIALKLGSKKATFKYTFGFIKAEMMAGFVNTLFLFVTMFYMIYESINRFFTPEIIEPIYMIYVGSIAIIANGVSAYILNNIGISSCNGHEHDHEDLNIKSAYLHMLSDALISVGVVVGGIIIYYYKIYFIDSILTIAFSVYILLHSYPLLKKSFLSLMDINTTDISKDELDKIIKEDDLVTHYHDLHIYKPSSNNNFISFHIILEEESTTLKSIERVTNKIRSKLKTYGFNHILIQTELTNNCVGACDIPIRKV